MTTTAPTNCRLCGYLCALTAHIKDGRVVAVEPDEQRYPYDSSVMAGCRRWRANVEILNHPQRVNLPLKRVGERGCGQWMTIPWSQAVDEIAEKLAALRSLHGPETLATSIGGPHATYWPLHRFLNLFGSPNNMGIGQICWNPAVWSNSITFGWPLDNELDPENTECATLWGMNPAESDNSWQWRSIREFSRTGKPLIVVDPRRTRTARVASHWLGIRPGTDSALALGLIHVLLRDGIYDLQFVQQWCNGLDELSAHVESYTPRRAAEITGLDAAQIEDVARLFAGATPSTILSGRGIDQTGTDSFATHRGIAILKALTGNIDRPGANHLGEMPDFTSELALELSERLPESQRLKQLGRESLLLQTYRAYHQVEASTLAHGRSLPLRYLTSAHPNLVWRAMISGEPYPIRAMVVMGSNPLLTQADTHLIERALRSLDLLVALEYFVTPTAMLADYILPAAGGLERSLLQTNAGVSNLAYGGPAAVAPQQERHSDFDFWRALGLRLGQQDDWPWETFEQVYDDIFAPLGFGWKEFCESGIYAPERVYYKHCETDSESTQPRGFATASGKIELCSQLLKQVGYDALPSHKPASPPPDGYPLCLITGARQQPFYASSYRQIESLRATHPIPKAELSATTAAQYGIADGDELVVETASGNARFTAKVVDILNGVISVEYGWWFPEDDSQPLGDIYRSNANALTSANFENCDPLLGQWVYNGIPCRIAALKQDRALADSAAAEGAAEEKGRG